MRSRYQIALIKAARGASDGCDHFRLPIDTVVVDLIVGDVIRAVNDSGWVSMEVIAIGKSTLTLDIRRKRPGERLTEKKIEDSSAGFITMMEKVAAGAKVRVMRGSACIFDHRPNIGE